MGNIATMATARFQSNGVDLLIDSLLAAGETAGDIRERLWQVAWARGYQDVLVPLPVPDVVIQGFCVLTQQFSPARTMVVIDDGEQLIGLIDKMEAPPLGAKVRLMPMYGVTAAWATKTLVTLGCGLSIRFDEDHAEPGWVDRLKACLHKIREGEIAVRRQIEIDRRNIVFVLPPTPFRVEMEAADKEIRERVTSGGYTEEEMKALNRAGKNQAEVDKVVAARNKRLVDAYRLETMEFRARIPELRAEFDKKMEAYAEFRKQIDRCNETDSASRSVTDATLRASQQLESIEQAVLNVRAVDLDRIEENPRRYFSELMQTIDLLYEMLPKRMQKQAASSATK
jgi:hypothetical protein